MRISDWSSDVCSSDLGGQAQTAVGEFLSAVQFIGPDVLGVVLIIRRFGRAERRTGTAAVVTARGHDAECGLRREMPGQTELRQESLVGFVERDLELVEAGVAAAAIGRASWRERVWQYV